MDNRQKMKKLSNGVLLQDMELKVGERFKVGRHIMVYVGNHGELDKFDTIVPLKVWRRNHDR